MAAEGDVETDDYYGEGEYAEAEGVARRRGPLRARGLRSAQDPKLARRRLGFLYARN